MAHLAILDLQTNSSHFAELLNRAGIGWAGAESERYRVWNENWEATLQKDGLHRLRASHDDMAIDFDWIQARVRQIKVSMASARRGWAQATRLITTP